jgi:putative transposase
VATWYYRSQARDVSVLRQRLRELATGRPRFGYERLHILLTREGWRIGRNKVHRLYKLEGLQVRMRARRRKRVSLHRGPAPRAAAAGQYWAMDFVHDQLADGRKFRVLTIIDKWHRQCVALHVDFSLSGQSVVDALNEVALERALPYAQLGKPTENGIIESFNGRLRDECLNVNEFVTLDDVRKILKAWRHDYNHCRPHGSLGNLTPYEFENKWSENGLRSPRL